MKFYEFAKLLKKYSSKTNAEFMTELIENITTYEIKLPGENALSKIIKGNSSFSGIAKKLFGKIEKEMFEGYLDDFYGEYKKTIIEDFNIAKKDEKNWAEIVTNIFTNIINTESGLNIKKVSTSKELDNVKDLVLDSTEGSIEETNDKIKSTMNKSINALEKIQSPLRLLYH